MKVSQIVQLGIIGQLCLFRNGYCFSFMMTCYSNDDDLVSNIKVL